MLRLAPFHYPHLVAAAGAAVKSLVAISLALGGLAVAPGGGAVAALAVGVAAIAIGAAAIREAGGLRRRCRLGRLRRCAFRELRGLDERGWGMRSRVRWPGGAPLAHFLTSPDGALTVALEVAEEAREHEVARIQAAASWLTFAGRPCVAVLAVGRVEGDQADEHGVLLVDAERVCEALCDAHGGYLAALDRVEAA